MAEKKQPTASDIKKQKIASWGFTLFGGVFLAIGIYLAWLANINRTWPTVEGTVRYIAVVPSRSSNSTQPDYYAQVHYGYVVGGKEYKSKRYSIGDGTRVGGLYKNREKAREEAQHLFPLRSTITIHYDPDDPESAVLKAGASLSSYWALIIGTAFFAFGVVAVRSTSKNASVE